MLAAQELPSVHVVQYKMYCITLSAFAQPFLKATLPSPITALHLYLLVISIPVRACTHHMRCLHAKLLGRGIRSAALHARTTFGSREASRAVFCY